jgi:hypothetical protein
MNRINELKLGHTYMFTSKSRICDLEKKCMLDRFSILTIVYNSKDYVLARNLVHYILLNYTEQNCDEKY